jgi:hypothetical protein
MAAQQAGENERVATGGVMRVIPAIDLKDGRCVRLRQGDMAAETVYSEDVPSVARRWQQQGVLKVFVQHQRILWLDARGVSPEQIAEMRARR